MDYWNDRTRDHPSDRSCTVLLYLMVLKRQYLVFSLLVAINIKKTTRSKAKNRLRWFKETGQKNGVQWDFATPSIFFLIL